MIGCLEDNMVGFRKEVPSRYTDGIKHMYYRVVTRV